jgi:tRNA U34 5-carboxymethylaminomethyl modifying GTPase MnmE/TrmE
MEWVKLAIRYCLSTTRFIIIGNKSDSQERKVTFEDGREFADCLNLPFFEISAKNDGNLDEILQFIKNFVGKEPAGR